MGPVLMMDLASLMAIKYICYLHSYYYGMNPGVEIANVLFSHHLIAP